jgi:hypothetical protein
VTKKERMERESRGGIRERKGMMRQRKAAA